MNDDMREVLEMIGQLELVISVESKTAFYEETKMALSLLSELAKEIKFKIIKLGEQKNEEKQD